MLKLQHTVLSWFYLSVVQDSAHLHVHCLGETTFTQTTKDTDVI